jgi:hypothetical protein
MGEIGTEAMSAIFDYYYGNQLWTSLSLEERLLIDGRWKLLHHYNLFWASNKLQEKRVFSLYGQIVNKKIQS